MIDVAVASNALGYRKIFDGTHGDTRMGPIDILAIGVRMRALEKEAEFHGPLAVILPEDKHLILTRLLGILAALGAGLWSLYSFKRVSTSAGTMLSYWLTVANDGARLFLDGGAVIDTWT